MSDYISREAAIEAITDTLKYEDYGFLSDELESVINNVPAADVVEVVRCKDCKYVGTDATCCLVCNREGMGLRPFHVYHDDFCSYGERKDG